MTYDVPGNDFKSEASFTIPIVFQEKYHITTLTGSIGLIHTYSPLRLSPQKVHLPALNYENIVLKNIFDLSVYIAIL